MVYLNQIYLDMTLQLNLLRAPQKPKENYRLGLIDEAKQAASILGYNYRSGEWYERSYKVFNKQYKAKKIDKEIRKLVDEGYNKAKEILTEKIDDLHKIAKALMTYETLTGEEIENIINKNIYPADKQDLKLEDDKGSAMDVLGLKPKIVH